VIKFLTTGWAQIPRTLRIRAFHNTSQEANGITSQHSV